MFLRSILSHCFIVKLLGQSVLLQILKRERKIRTMVKVTRSGLKETKISSNANKASSNITFTS